MSDQGGLYANKAGQKFEADVEEVLHVHHIRYGRQVHCGCDIYGNPRVKVDFLAYPWGVPLIIEAKWQVGGGSVDQKLVYTVLSLKKMDYSSLIVHGGDGARSLALNWVAGQADGKFLGLYSLPALVNLLEELQCPIIT